MSSYWVCWHYDPSQSSSFPNDLWEWYSSKPKFPCFDSWKGLQFWECGSLCHFCLHPQFDSHLVSKISVDLLPPFPLLSLSCQVEGIANWFSNKVLSFLLNHILFETFTRLWSFHWNSYSRLVFIVIEFDRKRVDHLYFEAPLFCSGVDSSLPHLFFAKSFLFLDGFDGWLADLEKCWIRREIRSLFSYTSMKINL